MITTVKELIDLYRASPECRPGNPQRERAFRRFREWFPRLTVEEAEHPSFRARLYDWRDTFIHRPHEGRNMLIYVNAFFNWAVDRGLMRDNPARAMRTLSPRQSRADIVWRPEQLEALFAAASEPVADVVRTVLWTGMRISDALKISKNHFDHGWLVYRPSKTRTTSGVTVYLPYFELPPLLAHFGHLLEPNWSRGAPILRAPKGQPWLYDTFHDHLEGTMREAGVVGLRCNDLRGTLVTWLLEAGCTDAEVGSITGHAVAGGNIRHYAARSKQLALTAYQKLGEYAAAHTLDRITARDTPQRISRERGSDDEGVSVR